MNSQKIIGIDPDVDKSGVCIVNEMLQIERLTTMDLVDLFALIEGMRDCDIRVIVEAGWMNKTNFHVRGMDSVWKSAKIGSHVGANHEIGRQIIKFCEKVGVEYHAIKPKGHKMNALDFKKRSGWTKRTNQEMRDAYKIILEAIK